MKLVMDAVIAFTSRSLPLRERGLKSLHPGNNSPTLQSLPLRERGLKFQKDTCIHTIFPVAPLAGAWIEISILQTADGTILTVAPLAGAWIEIVAGKTGSALPTLSLPLRERGLKSIRPGSMPRLTLSLPLRERGLKLQPGCRCSSSPRVAPLAGAWIEMAGIEVNCPELETSLPLRERGLKFWCSCIILWIKSRSPCGSVD